MNLVKYKRSQILAQCLRREGQAVMNLAKINDLILTFISYIINFILSSYECVLERKIWTR